jgi:hypothetical protein
MESDKEISENKRRRCGVQRRSFTYAQHIPERRTKGDRRDTQESDLESDNYFMKESEKQVSQEDSI